MRITDFWPFSIFKAIFKDEEEKNEVCQKKE